MKRWLKFRCLISALFLIQMGLPIAGLGQEAADSSLDSKVGVIYRDSQENLLLDIPNSKLSQGTRVVIITFPGQFLLCCAEVSEIASTEPETIHQVIFDRTRSVTYRLKEDRKSWEKYSLEKYYYDINPVSSGFGIIDSPDVFSSEGGEIVADLNSDGVQETFRDCTSHEGVHLTIWSGQPLKGARLWHAYLYVGYELEPSCVEKDFK